MRELQIKQALAGHLANQAQAHQVSLIEELRLHGGEVRADLVLVEQMHCFEIKSEADSLARLINQGSRYGWVFDRVTLVMAPCHVAKAMDLLPPWWGAMVVDSQAGTFHCIREAGLNVRHKAASLASILNKEEALEVLRKEGDIKGWRSKSLYLIQQHIAQALELDEIKEHIRAALLARASSATAVH
ncbi:sce7726 family protein [Stenotrophomonas maltophilia]|uniref:sce7726 family protein n=1 Tax=Stenotrophomonas maltophilia TaxID=40324 RepID=UPI0012FE1B06|nr:sce7726 family protein [Stenotrophomonas maltophilia]MBN5143341.1 sce7726 family protein [Stenotrophomonas maltophilia]